MVAGAMVVDPWPHKKSFNSSWPHDRGKRRDTAIPGPWSKVMASVLVLACVVSVVHVVFVVSMCVCVFVCVYHVYVIM